MANQTTVSFRRLAMRAIVVASVCIVSEQKSPALGQALFASTFGRTNGLSLLRLRRRRPQVVVIRSRDPGRALRAPYNFWGFCQLFRGRSLRERHHLPRTGSFTPPTVFCTLPLT